MTLGQVTIDRDWIEKTEIFPHKQMCKLKNNYFSLGESREREKEKVCTLNPSFDVDPHSFFEVLLTFFGTSLQNEIKTNVATR
jgi:hypothetical protein